MTNIQPEQTENFFRRVRLKAHFHSEQESSDMDITQNKNRSDDFNFKSLKPKGAFHLPELAGHIGLFVNGMRHFEGLFRQILRSCTF